MLTAALLLLLQAPAADPVAAAATRLNPAEIEDDNGPDMPFLGASSSGCAVNIRGRDKTFALDMAKVTGLAREDTFVFIAAGTHKLAIVGDASQPDQDAKLTALAQALAAVAGRCTKPAG